MSSSPRLRAVPDNDARAPHSLSGMVDARALIEALREDQLLSETAPYVPPPPHNLESERYVLGAILCGQLRADDLHDLEAEHFYDRHHQAIALLALFAAHSGREVASRDIVTTLAAAYPTRGDGWALLVDELENKVDCLAIPGVIEGHVANVRLLADARRLLVELQTLGAVLRTGALTREEIYQRGRDAFAPFRRSSP